MYIVGVVTAVATFLVCPFELPLHLRREGVFFDTS